MQRATWRIIEEDDTEEEVRIVRRNVGAPKSGTVVDVSSGLLGGTISPRELDDGIIHIHGHGVPVGSLDAPVDHYMAGMAPGQLADMLYRFYGDQLSGRTILLHGCAVGSHQYPDNLLLALQEECRETKRAAMRSRIYQLAGDELNDLYAETVLAVEPGQAKQRLKVTNPVKRQKYIAENCVIPAKNLLKNITVLAPRREIYFYRGLPLVVKEESDPGEAKEAMILADKNKSKSGLDSFFRGPGADWIGASLTSGDDVEAIGTESARNIIVPLLKELMSNWQEPT